MALGMMLQVADLGAVITHLLSVLSLAANCPPAYAVQAHRCTRKQRAMDYTGLRTPLTDAELCPVLY